MIDRPFTTVGRAPECDLRLSDLSISRFHCVLIRLGNDLWAVDLMGRGGVEVNARNERYSLVDDGSLIRLGRYLFTVRRQSACWPPALPVSPSTSIADSRNTCSLVARPALMPEVIGPQSFPIPHNLPVSRPPETSQSSEITRLAETMIAPLIDQFTMMQQHLFDQYHQSMMEMMAVFARLHHEQQDLVDRELRKIRRLTREVRTLRRELEEQRKTVAHSPTSRNGADLQSEPLPIASALRSAPVGTPEEYRAAQARIIARMTELQQERQGRWQRLLTRLGAGGIQNEE